MIRVNRTEFEFSHRKAPRGRGLWAFRVRRGREAIEFTHNGTFSEALKACRQWARTLPGAEEIIVQP